MTATPWRTLVALVTVPLAVSSAALRIFPDRGFLLDAVLLVACGLLLPAALRWGRAPVWFWLPVASTATALVLVTRHLDHTTWWGVPTGHTLREAGEVWRFALDYLPTAKPPVPYSSEWGVLFGTALGVTVLAMSVTAFALRAPRWALVPPGGAFCMFVVFGRGGGATAATIGYVVTTLVALALMAPGARQLPKNHGQHRHPVRGLVGVGGVVTVATVVGVLVGPALPGTQSDAWIPVRGRSAGSLLLDHPIVDIRGRLVDQSSLELFQVVSDQPSYWRLASLAEFDGVTFTVPRRQLYRLDLDTTGSATASLRHEVVITRLPGRLVPAAPEPARMDRNDVRLNPETASLVTPRLLREGDRFVIASAPPTLTAASLMGWATTAAGPVPDPVYTALPTGLPATVAATARAVVEGWGLDPDLAIVQPYVSALALQNWFRRTFDYRLDVTYGRDATAIVEFLEQRVGYCEQFAIAFAVMARTLGIPARVAVGFTPGERLADGTWSVQGRHSHAWPELWFADVGWVGFEPTPGRGAPGAETYTGVAAAQDGDGPSTGDGDGSDESTFEAGARPGDASTDDAEALAGLDVVPDVPLGEITVDGGDAAASPLPLLRALAGGLVIALGAGPVLVRWVRRERRRRRPPDAVVGDLWPRVGVWLIAARVPVTPAMTPREVLISTSRHHPDVARALAPLVDDVERTLFAGPGGRSVTTSSLLRHSTGVRRLLARKRRMVDRFADHVRPWRD